MKPPPKRRPSCFAHMARQTTQIKANPVPQSSRVSPVVTRYWIVKFAPFRTSWSEIVRRGTFTLRGVRSAQARRNLSLMETGDAVLFYHSQQEQAVVGVMTVSRAAYPDPTSRDPKWLTCDFTPLRTLPRPVPLSTVRAHPHLRNLALIRQPRLAVACIESDEFVQILRLAGESDDTRQVQTSTRATQSNPASAS
jgi:predicted RNA-binding protein with PUA-like domain